MAQHLRQHRLRGQWQRGAALQHDQAAIERAALATGMVPMFEAGLAGTTTLEEVTRSLRAEGCGR